MKNIYECRNPLCDNKVERYPSQVRSEAGVYCSKECKGIHQSETMKGEGNPNYRDGSTLDTVCECGNEKDHRSFKCAICAGKGYTLGEVRVMDQMGYDVPKEWQDAFSHAQKEVGKYFDTVAERLQLTGMKTAFSSRMNIDFSKFESVLKVSRTFKEAAEKLSLSQRDVAKAVKILNLDVSHMRPAKGRIATPENVFVQTTGRSKIVKQFALDNGLLKNVCSLCGQGPEWQDMPLTLELDHIDGNCENNELSNLRILCPNCHTQTPTYRGKRRE